MTRAVIVVSFFLVLIAAGGYRAQEGPAAAPVPGGLFTKAQADRGKALYDRQCASCHGIELVADDPASGDLTGGAYHRNWVGRTIAEKFEVTKTTMPPESPMMNTDQQYLEIVLYILNFNGYPVGEKEMIYDASAIEQLIISSQH